MGARLETICCVLRAEIAVHTGQVEAFEAWYQDLLTRHKQK
jgi:hypothetical protein